MQTEKMCETLRDWKKFFLVFFASLGLSKIRNKVSFDAASSVYLTFVQIKAFLRDQLGLKHTHTHEHLGKSLLLTSNCNFPPKPVMVVVRWLTLLASNPRSRDLPPQKVFLLENRSLFGWWLWKKINEKSCKRLKWAGISIDFDPKRCPKTLKWG